MSGIPQPNLTTLQHTQTQILKIQFPVVLQFPTSPPNEIFFSACTGQKKQITWLLTDHRCVQSFKHTYNSHANSYFAYHCLVTLLSTCLSLILFWITRCWLWYVYISDFCLVSLDYCSVDEHCLLSGLLFCLCLWRDSQPIMIDLHSGSSELGPGRDFLPAWLTSGMSWLPLVWKSSPLLELQLLAG